MPIIFVVTNSLAFSEAITVLEVLWNLGVADADNSIRRTE